MKNLKKILSNEAGMSLVEVIVAAAISVIISGAVMKTNQTGIKGVQTVSTKISLQMWQSTVLMNQLSDPVGCMNNHSGSVAAHSRTDLIGKDGNPIATNGQEIVGTGGDWQLGGGAGNPIQFQAFVEDTPGSTKGRCDLSITITNLRNGFGGKTQTLNIPVTCTTDTGQTTVQSCSATMDASDNVWQLTLGGGVIPEHISSGATRNVLVGLEDGTGGNADDITAPFQVNIGDSDFPNGSGSGVVQSMRILGERRAMVFDQVGLFESGDCLMVGTDDAGTLRMRNSFCNATLRLNSEANITLTGTRATAISSDNSTVSGVNSSVISSTGNGSFASQAIGSNAVVLGASNVTVSGTRSVGMGEDNVVSGANALVAGYNNTVSGRGALALGNNNIVSGDDSFSAGYNNNVSGNGAVAFGYNAVVSGGNSLAGGTSSAHGWASFAFGQESVAQASKSIAMGWNAEARGANSKVFADHSDVTGSYSVAMGYDLTVSGSASMALGFGGSASNRTIESQSHHFTAMFNNGFAFKTDPWNQNDHTDNVYISGEGQLLVGNNVSHPDDYRTNFQVFNKLDNSKYSIRANRDSIWMADGKIVAWGGGDQMWAGLSSYDDNWQTVGVGLVPTRGDSTAWPMGHMSTFGINMGYSDGDKRWRISSDGASNGSAGMVMNYGPGWLGLYAKTSNGGWGHLVDKTALTNYIRMYIKGDRIEAKVPIYMNTTLLHASDRRLKKNINKIENPLDIISQLNGYRYTWKSYDELPKDLQSKENMAAAVEREDIGVIAQEVEKVLPELVKVNKGYGNTKSVSYSQMIAVIIEGVKELADKVSQNVKDIMGLNDKVDSLERRVSSLEEENKQMRAQLCELHPELKSCKK